jgi:hypothetical protein
MTITAPATDTSPHLGRYLDTCTNHLTQQEAQTAARALHLEGPTVIDHPHGLWVHVSQDDPEDFEQQMLQILDAFPNLVALIRYARALAGDVYWINFDQDAAPVPGLPTYDW